METTGVRRAANMTTADKQHLVDLVAENASVLECKETDKVSIAQKAEAWKALATHFNSASSVRRNGDQLKQAFGNLKKGAKKGAARDKVERFRTGGGPCETVLTELDSKVLALLGNRAVPLPNSYDSDAAFMSCVSNAEISGDGSLLLFQSHHEAALELAMEPACLQLTGQLPAACSESLSSACLQATLADALITASTQQPLGVMAVGQSPAATDEPVIAGPSTAAGPQLVAASGSSKQWAGRRRPRRAMSSATATADAAAQLATMAQSEAAYFTAKLAMDQKEHEIKMRIFVLQEEYEIKTLKKLEE